MELEYLVDLGTNLVREPESPLFFNYFEFIIKVQLVLDSVLGFFFTRERDYWSFWYETDRVLHEIVTTADFLPLNEIWLPALSYEEWGEQLIKWGEYPLPAYMNSLGGFIRHDLKLRFKLMPEDSFELVYAAVLGRYKERYSVRGWK